MTTEGRERKNPGTKNEQDNKHSYTYRKKTGISNGGPTPTLMKTQQKTHKRRRQKRSRDHV